MAELLSRTPALGSCREAESEGGPWGPCLGFPVCQSIPSAPHSFLPPVALGARLQLLQGGSILAGRSRAAPAFALTTDTDPVLTREAARGQGRSVDPPHPIYASNKTRK